MSARPKPIACEGFNDRLLDDYGKKGLCLNEIKLMTFGKGWLIFEFGGQTKQDAADQARALMEHLKKRKNDRHIRITGPGS